MRSCTEKCGMSPQHFKADNFEDDSNQKLCITSYTPTINGNHFQPRWSFERDIAISNISFPTTSFLKFSYWLSGWSVASTFRRLSASCRSSNRMVYSTNRPSQGDVLCSGSIPSPYGWEDDKPPTFQKESQSKFHGSKPPTSITYAQFMYIKYGNS